MKHTIRYILIFCLTIFSNCIIAQEVKQLQASKEIDFMPSGSVKVKTNGGRVEVNTWDQPKVKVTIIANDSVGANLSNDEIFSKLNVEFEKKASQIEITLESSFKGYGTVFSNSNLNLSSGLEIKPTNTGATGGRAGSGTTKSRRLIISIPKGSDLKLDCDYSDITLLTDIESARTVLVGSTLLAKSFKSLVMRAAYSYVSLVDVGRADIEFQTGNLQLNNVEFGNFETVGSVIEMSNVGHLFLKSTNDEYTIEEAGKIEGRKSSNVLRIDKLTGRIELEGKNFDLKLRTIAPETELIKVYNQYGKLRLPVKNLSNYSINFSGWFSKIFTAFDITPVVIEKDGTEKKGEVLKVAESAQSDYPYSKSYQNRVYYSNGAYNSGGSPAKFTAVVGDIKGKHTKFELICNSCTVDFK